MKKRSMFYGWISVILATLTGLAIYLYVPQYFADEVYPLDYAPLIVKYSSQYEVDPTLVAAMILQESRFNPRAVSSKGAKGLMQFMPATASTMAKETGRWPDYDLFDPETSIEFGAAHIRDLLIKYNGNLDAALAGYNAGTGNADAWVRKGLLDRIPFRETNNYVKKIKNYQTVYASMYANELGVELINLEAKTDKKESLRGFVWSQIFSNFSNFLDKR